MGASHKLSSSFFADFHRPCAKQRGPGILDDALCRHFLPNEMSDFSEFTGRNGKTGGNSHCERLIVVVNLEGRRWGAMFPCKPTSLRRIPTLNTDTLNTDFALHRLPTDSDQDVGVMRSRWSRAISDRYRLCLSAELVDWFDSGVCDRLGGSEFCEPAHPEALLDESPECIWPGLMPPDVLPLVGNGLGDWLCGKVSARGSIDEIVYWYHGGGDYLPYGKSLAEAIVFDTLADRLPGRRQLLAIPAECDPIQHNAIVSAPLVTWALRHLPQPISELMDVDAAPERIAAALLRHEIAVDAVRCDAVLAALDNPVRSRMTHDKARKLGLNWERDIAKWMFDTDLMPAEIRIELANEWRDLGERPFAQDWSEVEQHCRIIASHRNDLGWVHDCLGWVAQRSGQPSTAVQHYNQASKTSIFTDQSVRFRTHFDSEEFAKFSVARLVEMGLAHNVDPQYVRALSQTATPRWREGVVQYWLGQLESNTAAASDRYQMIFAAGWDVGCDSILRYRELIERLGDAAMDANQFGRAEVARTHAHCIDSRYRRSK